MDFYENLQVYALVSLLTNIPTCVYVLLNEVEQREVEKAKKRKTEFSEWQRDKKKKIRQQQKKRRDEGPSTSSETFCPVLGGGTEALPGEKT